MCNPAFALAGLKIGETGVNYVLQNEHSKDAAKFQSARAAATSEAVQEDVIQQASQIARREEEEARAASRALTQIVRDAQLRRGEVKAQAGASGVSGTSVGTTLADFEAQEQARLVVNQDNLESSLTALDDRRRGVFAEGTRVIQSSLGTPVQRPNLFQALFSIGAAAFQGAIDNPARDVNPGDDPND